MNCGATVAAALYATLSVLLSVAALLGALRLVRVLVT